MRKRLRILAATLLITLFGHLCVHGQSLYQIDDGDSETQIGNGDAFVNWGNMFAVDEMGPILENITVGIGGNGDGISLIGDNLEWRVFNDDDGNPTSGMVELAAGSHAIQINDFGINGFVNVIDIPDTDVSGDSFVFIAVTYDGTALPNTFPAAIDQDSDLLQSWIAASADPSDFSGADLISNFGLPGNWIIRGNDDPSSNVIAVFDDDSGTLNSVDPLPAVFVDSGLAVSDATQVGLAAFTNPGTWPVGTWAADYDPEIYVTITVTPGDGNQIDFGTVSWFPGFFNSTAGGIRTSLDSFATDVAVANIQEFPAPTTFDISALTGVSEPVELRIYFSGAGTFSDLGTAGTSSGLIFTGNVASSDFVLGDINCDGEVNLLDVTPFVDLLTSGMFLDKADINGDGSVDLLDVGPFVDLLL